MRDRCQAGAPWSAPSWPWRRTVTVARTRPTTATAATRRRRRAAATSCTSPSTATRRGSPSCSVFLAWAARNAAEPAYVSQAAQRAWGSGVAMPETPGGSDGQRLGRRGGRGRRAVGATAGSGPLPARPPGRLRPPDRASRGTSGRGGAGADGSSSGRPCARPGWPVVRGRRPLRSARGRRMDRPRVAHPSSSTGSRPRHGPRRPGMRRRGGARRGRGARGVGLRRGR